MKTARIETFLFGPGTAKNLLFCRVEATSGIHMRTRIDASRGGSDGPCRTILHA